MRSTTENSMKETSLDMGPIRFIKQICNQMNSKLVYLLAQLELIGECFSSASIFTNLYSQQ